MSKKSKNTSDSDSVLLDLNNPVFQQTLFSLQKGDKIRVLTTLKKISTMTWLQVYRDKGLRWEMIHSRVGPHGHRLYSFRISKGFRALAYREETWLRLLSLHPDHDSAYRPPRGIRIILLRVAACNTKHPCLQYKVISCSL